MAKPKCYYCFQDSKGLIWCNKCEKRVCAIGYLVEGQKYTCLQCLSEKINMGNCKRAWFLCDRNSD
jgi:hypothetical protein